MWPCVLSSSFTRNDGVLQCTYCTAGRDSDCLRAGRSGDRVPVGGEVFRTRPDLPWSLLCSGYRVCFQGVKRLGRGFDHPPPSSAKLLDRVKLYLYFPCRPSRPVLGWGFSDCTDTFRILLISYWCLDEPECTVHTLCQSIAVKLHEERKPVKGEKTSNPLQQRAERGNREMKGNKIASGREPTLRYSCVAPLRRWILIGWVAAVMMGFRWYLALRHVPSPPRTFITS
jgi:hypothetical protein